MCNPTTGSPTITLCQLRPNYHIVSDPPKMQVLRDRDSLKFTLRELLGQKGRIRYAAESG